MREHLALEKNRRKNKPHINDRGQALLKCKKE